MKNTFTRGRVAALAALVAIGAFVVVAGASAIAAPSHSAKSEHWGVIARNTEGSPVADLRDGPYVPFGVGNVSEPPFGKGSLGIEVADSATTRVPPAEKVDFGNEVDFLGDPVLGINQTGFHVFQTGENVTFGGARNMPNIRFEIDANLQSTACTADNFTTMVWVPGPAPVVNRWSGYIDATTNGNWYFTGAEAGCTLCTEALNCNWTQAKAALNDGPPTPIIYTVMVGKGRDNLWAGAVDGFRINSDIYDFESEPKGVHRRHAHKSG